MAENGLVRAIVDDSVEVSMIRSEACAKCGLCSVGHRQEEMILLAKNLCDAKVGDQVKIELRDGQFIRSVLIMYGIPLVFLIFGVFLGNLMSVLVGGWFDIPNEVLVSILCLVFAIVFLFLSFKVIRLFEKNVSKKEILPLATEIIIDENDV